MKEKVTDGQTSRPPELRVSLEGLIVDNFAGGGGASTGIEWALGRSPDFAINHDKYALAMHEANHPNTMHLQEDVWDVDPARLCAGRPVSLAWFSPDCTFHSRARGGKPFRDRDRAKRRRGLAWVVTRWARAVRPRVICLENVPEFEEWGPLLDDGMPDPDRRGFTYRRWRAQLENLGYVVESAPLVACDYGAPTSRRRLFVIARCDGRPIVWPEPTHGPGRLPYRTAAECIDWSVPCPSIFTRKRPLAAATLRRIARGIRRYVIDSASPFIIPMTHPRDARIHAIGEPFRTITGAHRGELALVAPALIQTSYGEREGQAPRALDIQAPLGTIVAGGVKHSLVAAFLARHYGGHENDGADFRKPISTITMRDHHSVVSSHLVKFYGTSTQGIPLTDPMPTITANGRGGGHLAEVRAFLMAYYGTDQDAQLRQPMPTVTTRDRFALVTVHGQDYVIADIGMRMLEARELFNGQSFNPDYIIDPVVELRRGKKLVLDRLPKTRQIMCVGNSVPPRQAMAIVQAQFADEEMRAAV